MNNTEIKLKIQFVALIISFVLIACSSSQSKYSINNDKEEKVPQYFSDYGEDNFVALLKNSFNQMHPEYRFGDVFGEYLIEPSWRHFTSQDNCEIVEITGKYNYEGKNKNAKLQFIIYTNDRTTEVWMLSFDGVVQSKSVTRDFINDAFDSYIKNHDTENSIIKEDRVIDTGDDIENNEAEYVPEYYVFPDSDKRYLTEEDVHEMDASYVRLGLNEIYARHGRKFNDTELQNYFSSQAWYTPEYTPDEFSAIEGSVFNEYEKANVEFLANLIK